MALAVALPSECATGAVASPLPVPEGASRREGWLANGAVVASKRYAMVGEAGTAGESMHAAVDLGAGFAVPSPTDAAAAEAAAAGSTPGGRDVRAVVGWS